MGEELALYLVQSTEVIAQVIDIQKAVEDFLPHREMTIQRLREEADKLDEHNLRGNVAKVVGGSTSLGAGLVGLALAPLTFGISAIVGTGVAAAGVVTAYGTKAVLMKISSDTKKKVNAILDADERASITLRRRWNEFSQICKQIAKFDTKWSWKNIAEFAFWIINKAFEFLISTALGKLVKWGAVVTKTLFSIYTNDYFKTNIKDPFLKGNYTLLLENLASIIKRLSCSKEFWVDFLHISGIGVGAAITAYTTAAGGFFVGTAGSLAIIGYSELISAIINMVQGSVTDVSIAIRKKAKELEFQESELRKCVMVMRQHVSELRYYC